MITPKEGDQPIRALKFKAKFANNMLKEFPIKFKKEDKAANPVGTEMFGEDKSKKLSSSEAEIFHRTRAKVIFLCK